MNEKFYYFIQNTKELNSRFQIIPLLYGSLGLEILTKHNFDSDDIDILIPELYLLDKWSDFKQCLEKKGYKLIDEKRTYFYKR